MANNRKVMMIISSSYSFNRKHWLWRRRRTLHWLCYGLKASEGTV